MLLQVVKEHAEGVCIDAFILDFNSDYALLNFVLQVQLSEAIYCNILGGKETIQVCSTFDQGLLVLLEERPGAR